MCYTGRKFCMHTVTRTPRSSTKGASLTSSRPSSPDLVKNSLQSAILALCAAVLNAVLSFTTLFCPCYKYCPYPSGITLNHTAQHLPSKHPLALTLYDPSTWQTSDIKLDSHSDFLYQDRCRTPTLTSDHRVWPTQKRRQPKATHRPS